MGYSRIFYYSPTDVSFKVYNFESQSVEREIKCHFKIEKDFEFFMFLEYNEAKKKIYFVHMKDFSQCVIEECSESNPQEINIIAEFELRNPNCIYYDKQILYFGTQAEESSPLRMHFLKDGVYFSLDFSYTENIQILDAGFYISDVMYILYNHNEKPESGVFLISKKLDPKVSASVVDFKEETVQKIVLCGEDSPDILDGRIIVDKLLSSVTVTGMDCIRRYHLGQKNGKYSAKFLTSKTIEQSIDYVPLNRDSLTSWEYEEDKKEATIRFYRATDTRCLYHWLFQQNGLANEFNIADLNDLCELLI